MCFVSTCTYSSPFVSSFAVFFFEVWAALTWELRCTFHNGRLYVHLLEGRMSYRGLIQDISIKVFVCKKPCKNGHLSTLEITWKEVSKISCCKNLPTVNSLSTVYCLGVKRRTTKNEQGGRLEWDEDWSFFFEAAEILSERSVFKNWPGKIKLWE